jgi:hypothetical protein
MQHIVQIIFQTPDCPGILHNPFGFPFIKSFNRLPSVVCLIYHFRSCHALFLVFTLQVIGNIPQFVRPTPLDWEVRICYFNGTVQPLAAINTDKLTVITHQSSLIQVIYKGFPLCFTLTGG